MLYAVLDGTVSIPWVDCRILCFFFFVFFLRSHNSTEISEREKNKTASSPKSTSKWDRQPTVPWYVEHANNNDRVWACVCVRPSCFKLTENIYLQTHTHDLMRSICSEKVNEWEKDISMKMNITSHQISLETTAENARTRICFQTNYIIWCMPNNENRMKLTTKYIKENKNRIETNRIGREMEWKIDRVDKRKAKQRNKRYSVWSFKERHSTQRAHRSFVEKSTGRPLIDATSDFHFRKI